MTTTNPKLLRRADAADYIGLKTRTLDNWRTAGKGPRFVKLGRRVVYQRDELDRYVQSCTRSSTAA